MDGQMRKLMLMTAVTGLMAGCASQSGVGQKGYAFKRGEQLASHAGVNPALVHYVIKRESNGRMNAANSSSSARGPMQVIDATAAAIAGRSVSRQERMGDIGLKLGVAYLKTCEVALPFAAIHSIWTRCYVQGHGAVGGNIEHARRAFAQMYGV